MVNVTLPDDKQNYVHRIGRVGRAERMGLAISLVSRVKEKVGRGWGLKGGWDLRGEAVGGGALRKGVGPC